MRLPRPRRHRGATLRSRLVGALALLLVAVCLGVATLTTVALRGYLVDRLDAQLAAADTRSTSAGNRPDGGAGERDGGGGGGRGRGSGTDFVRTAGQAAGTLGARVAGGQVTASVLDDAGTAVALAGDDLTALAGVPADGRPHTVDLGPQGDYRVLAATTTDGDVLLTGLPLEDVTTTVERLVGLEIGVSLGALALAVGAGTLIVRRTLRPLERVADTAARVVSLPLDRGEVELAVRVDPDDTDPRTEVGRVGAALNALLDRVAGALTARQQSETRVRQLVADASHELRTPLAAIRGYAELTRPARAGVDPELRHALERVESEAVRMTVLVEDLLTLARIDAGRAPATDPVDLTRLVLDTVSDARAAGPAHHWRLDLPDDPVVVPGDEHGLHQVLANLLANGRTHTPAGTTVTTTLRPAGPGAVALVVADDGPGIPAEVLPGVFDRFVMGGTARGPGAGSTGLGLAIVEATVTAHGGTVTAASEPGRTTLTVTLPAPPPG